MLRANLRPVRIGLSKHVLDEAAHLPQISNASGSSCTANAFQITIELLQRVGTELLWSGDWRQYTRPSKKVQEPRKAACVVGTIPLRISGAS